MPVGGATAVMHVCGLHWCTFTELLPETYQGELNQLIRSGTILTKYNNTNFSVFWIKIFMICLECILQWRFCVGDRGHRPPLPKSCPGPPNFFQGNSVLLLVDVIAIVLSLSRCCLPNDEGPAPPQIFFPRTVPGILIQFLSTYSAYG